VEVNLKRPGPTFFHVLNALKYVRHSGNRTIRGKVDEKETVKRWRWGVVRSTRRGECWRGLDLQAIELGSLGWGDDEIGGW